MGISNMQIERIHRPDRRRLEQCIAAHKPAIFTGLMDGETATRSWDLPYLQSRIGKQQVEYVRHSSPRIYWDPESGLPTKTSTFTDFAENALFAKDGHFSYLQDDVNSFPALKADFELPRMMSEKPLFRTKLWLSGRGMITPLHYDPVETFHWVIRGSKRFSFFSPGLRAYYPFSWRTRAPFISQLDPDDLDRRRFPHFTDAVRIECEMKAGDVLYLPAFWWHQVYSSESLNISLNFVWFASLLRNTRHVAQFARCYRHILWRFSQARAKAKQARGYDIDVRANPAS
jgi:hypothetical protein